MKARVSTSLRTATFEILKVVRDPYLLVWSAFILVFPFYIFESGLPQPGGLFVLLLVPMLLLQGRKKRLPGEMRRALKALLVFTGYVLVVNLLWSVVLMTFTTNAKNGFLLSPTYYIYNAILLWIFFRMHMRYGATLDWLTVHLVLISVAAQVVISFIMPGGARAMLMFNNPNQLGYFALLSACILLIGQRRLNLSTVKVTLGLMACSYLALISASKAALVSIALLTVVLLLSRARTMLVAGLVLGVLAITPNPFSNAIGRAQDRIEVDQKTNASMSLIEQRGYDRILNNPEYCLLGAGEGAHGRFRETTVIGAHELHSSFGTLLFCYGIIGIALFMTFVWLVLRGSPWSVLLLFGAAFAFGMAHQGLRFGMFWVLIGMAVSQRTYASQRRATIPREAVR